MRWLIIGLLAVIGFGLISPSLDQKIALLPFDTISNSFYGATSYWCSLVYLLVPVMVVLLIAIPILLLLTKKSRKKYGKGAVVILLSLALGPGLIVNVLCKNHWGRARPYQVIQSGERFSPVWQPHFNAPNDNSFCSGHAAVGFFLGVPFWAFARKKAAVVVGTLAGSVVGLVRILQGGHYFSDIVFAGIMVIIGTMLSWMIIDRIANLFDANNEF